MASSHLFSAVHALHTGTPDSCLAQLTDLVAALRHLAARQEQPVAQLEALLGQHPEYARALCARLLELFGRRGMRRLHSDAGIKGDEGFWSALVTALGERLLPPLPTGGDACLRQLFQPGDADWLRAVPAADWQQLFARLRPHLQADRRAGAAMAEEIINALRILSARLAGSGSDAELLRNAPELEQHDSPFVTQGAAIARYCQHHDDWRHGRREQPDDAGEVQVLLDQCRQVLERVRRQALKSGTSIRLTRLMRQLRATLQRMSRLIDALDDTPATREQACIALLGDYADAVARHNRVRTKIAEDIDVIAVRVVDNASHHGEHYASETRREYVAMLRAASLGGVIVAFMALAKVGISALHLAPLNHALAVSLNYGLGFVLIHLIGGVIATKQPAMTASLLANTLSARTPAAQRYAQLALQMERIARTQFIAIAGNVLLVMPVALALCVLWQAATGSAPIPEAKAWVMARELSPYQSLALPHAALAGVCLFLAGILSGLFDNHAAYGELAARIKASPGWNKRLGAARCARVADYLDDHWGALWGNLLFGFLLGGVGTLGLLFGLPLDIRHVTFSSANYVYSGYTLGAALPWWDWLINALGVLLIATVNLVVSFTLALMIALRARAIERASATATLGEALKARWRTHRRAFFLPPPDGDNCELPATAPDRPDTKGETR